MTKHHFLPSISNTWLRDLLLLGLLLGVLFGAFLGSYPLEAPDGARYAEIPREMVLSGDYVTPTVNYVKYFEKPPLFYWMQTVSVRLFGLSEWSMRLMNALMAWAGCLMVYVAGRRLYDRRTGWMASGILATSALYFVMTHIMTIDMTLSTLLSSALFCFILGTRAPPGSQRSRWMWAMYALSALAVLTKGLIGIVFPGMIVFVWLLLTHQWRELKTYCLPTGILLFLLIALPWHVLVQQRNPEFFHFYFIEQHFLRYLTNYAGRRQAFWFLPLFVVGGLLPWAFFLVQALRHSWPHPWSNRHKAPDTLFLLVWPGMITLFYAFSHSLLAPYFLPILPPLALLIGHYLAEKIPPRRVLKIMAVTAIVLVPLNPLLPIANHHSVHSLAMIIRQQWQPSDEVATYREYYQDLPFYLRQRVTVADWKNELRLGMQHQDARAWMISRKTFWKRWHSGKRMFMITSQKLYRKWQRRGLHKNAHVLGETVNNILLTNQAPKKCP